MGVGRPGTWKESQTKSSAFRILRVIIFTTNEPSPLPCRTQWKRSRRFTDLPWDVGLPAPPRLTEVLQDGSGLVLFDALGHHVQDVVHHGGTQLQVEVRLHALFGDSLGHALGVTSCWGN